MRRKKEAQKEARSGPRLLSSLGLTPGTPLMAMIQESLTYYICRRLQTSAWQHLHFELSGATVKVSSMRSSALSTAQITYSSQIAYPRGVRHAYLPVSAIAMRNSSSHLAHDGVHSITVDGASLTFQGEGEVKILSRLLRPWADVQPEDTHAVIANDSDVVLMALVTPARNVYVLAEPGRVARRGVPSPAHAGAAAAGKGGAAKGRQGRARVAAGARGLPMMMGFTCFSVAALQRLWLHKHPFLRGATPQVGALSLEFHPTAPLPACLNAAGNVAVLVRMITETVPPASSLF